VMRVDFRHCQVLDPVGDAVAFPKSIEFWKDRRIFAQLELEQQTSKLALNVTVERMFVSAARDDAHATARCGACGRW
jgi:hypothetical protein